MSAMKGTLPEDLGRPNIHFSGLKMWISGRQFPNSSDYWDGNWLNATACCESMASLVWTQGSIIHLSEIDKWLNALKELNRTVHGEAELPCIETELRAKVVLDELGNGCLTVNITPNNLEESHRFTFEVDQSFLPGVIRSLESVLDRYPIRGNKSRK